MEVHRLWVKSELQLPAYAIATAMPDLSRICNLYHSSWQCHILNPLSEARDQTCILVVTSQVLNLLSYSCPLAFVFFFFFFFLVFSRAAFAAYGGSQARGLIGAIAASLYHSHSHVGSELPLRPTPQLMATPDP